MQDIQQFDRDRCYGLLRRHGLTPRDIDTLIITEDRILPNCITLYRLVQHTMRRLPEMQRQALILYAEEHFSYAEVADIMDTRLSTVRSRLYQAKHTLKALLNLHTEQKQEMVTSTRSED